MKKELSEEEIAAITVAFSDLDRDGDGVITLDELRAAMAAQGRHPSDEALRRELGRADLNADGQITLREWLQMWSAAILRGA
ncbi:MAG: EF-hand domain-containing protein [Myxococcales bacterium]|nr:EF-hand domain-containing protein [Myxococcales bacterium]